MIRETGRAMAIRRVVAGRVRKVIDRIPRPNVSP
jgi:hypothetical protein